MEDGVGFIVLMVLIFVIGLLSHSCGVNANQAEAVKAGAAEYYLDTNYVRQFRWLPK